MIGNRKRKIATKKQKQKKNKSFKIKVLITHAMHSNEIFPFFLCLAAQINEKREPFTDNKKLPHR